MKRTKSKGGIQYSGGSGRWISEFWGSQGYTEKTCLNLLSKKKKKKKPKPISEVLATKTVLKSE